MSPLCDLEFEHWKPIFPHDIPAYNDASLCQVWLQNVLWFRRYHPDKHSLTFWSFTMTLTMNTAIPFFLTLADTNVPSIQVWLQTDQMLRRYIRNSHILIILALVGTFTTLKIANQFFCKTLRLMIIHHHTKFGYKRLSGSGDIIWTKSRHMDRQMPHTPIRTNALSIQMSFIIRATWHASELTKLLKKIS